LVSRRLMELKLSKRTLLEELGPLKMERRDKRPPRSKD